MVQAIFARVRLCERGRRRVAKKPYDLSPKYLCFSLYKRFVVHTCMWLDITGLRFVLSQSVKHFILSRSTSNLVCIPISVFSTLAFYRPHNNSISLFEKATFQFRCCKTSLVGFMSYSPVKLFQHVLFRLRHFLECTHHKLSGI